MEPTPSPRKKSKPKSPKRQSSQQRLRARYEAGDPTVDLLGESFGAFDYFVEYNSSKNQIPDESPNTPPDEPPQAPPPSDPDPPTPCYMFGPTSSTFHTNFPPLSFEHPQEQTLHSHKIPAPQKIASDGTKQNISVA